LFAAYLYRKYFSQGKKVIFAPTPAGSTYTLPQEGTVVFLDMTPTPTVVDQCLERKLSVEVIDHHASAQKENLPYLQKHKLGEVLFDLKASAALLVAIKGGANGDNLRMAEYVDDRDRWQWKLPHSQAISEYLYVNLPMPHDHESTLESFTRISEIIDTPFEEMRLRGEIYLEHSQFLIQQLTASVQFGTLTTPKSNKYRVAIVETQQFRSEVGSELMKKYGDRVDCAVCWRYAPEVNAYYLSLRSTANHVDVGEVAREFIGVEGVPGGGHHDAAGCEFVGDFLSFFDVIVLDKE
jgi:oligoribonuclease NrnB/cAMP/cGMP phosphodiesterase (DHH superfamily)